MPTVGGAEPEKELCACDSYRIGDWDEFNFWNYCEENPGATEIQAKDRPYGLMDGDGNYLSGYTVTSTDPSVISVEMTENDNTTAFLVTQSRAGSAFLVFDIPGVDCEIKFGYYSEF